jgi:hypothetical protein
MLCWLDANTSNYVAIPNTCLSTVHTLTKPPCHCTCITEKDYILHPNISPQARLERDEFIALEAEISPYKCVADDDSTSTGTHALMDIGAGAGAGTDVIGTDEASDRLELGNGAGNATEAEIQALAADVYGRLGNSNGSGNREGVTLTLTLNEVEAEKEDREQESPEIQALAADVDGYGSFSDINLRSRMP